MRTPTASDATRLHEPRRIEARLLAKLDEGRPKA